MSIPLFEIYQTNTTIYLRDVVRSIRECKSTAEEREFVAKETALIRKVFREENNEFRAVAVVKLLYFYILGYPAHIGQVECLKLIASERFSDKRIGYLGCMMLLDELAEIHVLLTNCLKNDIEHPSKYVKSLALCTFASICSQEMSDALGPYIEKLFDFPDRYVRKKAILCMARIVRKCPEYEPSYAHFSDSMLKETSQIMQMCWLTLAIEMCERSEKAVQFFKKMDGLVSFAKKILVILITHGTTSDNCVHGVANPFLQIKCIRLFKYLAFNDSAVSAEITDILAQVITSTTNKVVVGFSVIYEAIACIMAIESKKELRTLAINSVGPFLSSNVKNVRFIGLTTLQRVAITNCDHDLIVRHKDLISQCVVDSDDTIKKRAVELLFSILDSKDVVDAVENLMENLNHFSDDMKRFSTSFIVTAIERHSPNQEWMIDKFLMLMQYVSGYIRDDTLVKFVGIISNCTLQQKVSITNRFYSLLCTFPKQDALIQLASWCIGEYGYQLIGPAHNISMHEIVEILKRNFTHPDLKTNTYHFIANALIKFSTKVPSAVECSKHIFNLWKQSLDTELQQRAIEYDAILSGHRQLIDVVFSPMPPLELDNLSDVPLDGEDETIPQSHKVSFKHSLNFNPTSHHIESKLCDSSKPSNHETIVHDLLDLLGDSPPNSYNCNNSVRTAIENPSNTDTLAVIKNQTHGIVLNLSYSYPQANPHSRNMWFTAMNSSMDDISDFRIQVATTKNIHLTVNSQSGTVLSSFSLNQIQQQLTLNVTEPNSFKNVIPKLKIRVTFNKLGQDFEIIENVLSFPATFSECC